MMMAATDILAPRDKFACIGLPHVSHDLPAVLEIADDLHLATEVPFGLNDYVERWMGEVYSEQFSKCDLFILARRTSATPADLDGESVELQRTCARFLLSLLLQGSLHVGNAGITLTGTRESGGVYIRQMGRPRAYQHYAGTSRLHVAMPTLEAAYGTCAGLAALDRSGDHARLKRGFRAFQAALEAEHAEDRLHQSVRAIEAIIKPEQGKTRKQFKSRLSDLTGLPHSLVGEMYDLRSATEHMNELKDALPSLFQPDETPALTRVYQAHEIARWLYGRMLRDNTLLQHFETDGSIQALHVLGRGEKQRLFGRAPDFDALRLGPR